MILERCGVDTFSSVAILVSHLSKKVAYRVSFHMTDTLLRMTYLGDGISTDDDSLEDENEKDEGGSFVPLPTEEGVPDGEEPLESSEEV